MVAGLSKPPGCSRPSDKRNSSIPADRRRRPCSRTFRWRHRSSGKPRRDRPRSRSHPGTPPLLHRTFPCYRQGLRYPCPWAPRSSVRRCPGCWTGTPLRNAPGNNPDPPRRKGPSGLRSFRSPHISGSHWYASRKYPASDWRSPQPQALSSTRSSWSPGLRSPPRDAFRCRRRRAPACRPFGQYPRSERSDGSCRPPIGCCSRTAAPRLRRPQKAAFVFFSHFPLLLCIFHRTRSN